MVAGKEELEKWMKEHPKGEREFSEFPIWSMGEPESKTKKIIKDVTGVTPTFWRPPFGDVDNRVRAIATAMGLQTSIWTRISPTATFDTEGMIISWWCGCVRLITIFQTSISRAAP